MSALFEPLRIGMRTARNRITRAATTTNLSAANKVTDRLIAHYERLARGGVGMIVTDALRIHPSILGGQYGIAAYREDCMPGLALLAEAVHAEGTLLVGQLNHSGRQHTASSVPGNLVGPSAIACPRSGGVPHPLTVVEIEELVGGFVQSAVNLSAAGFDGVELNGAQGHLLQQFLSPFSNHRGDAYGGDGRRRFAEQILSRIRAEAGTDFIVGYRLGVDEFTTGGLTTAITAAFAGMLEDAGLVDYVSFSQGNFNSIAAHLPDRHYPPTPFAAVQSEVGRTLRKTVRIACTRIQHPVEAERILGEGWADAVALGRALTADPDWPNKAQAGRSARIRPCIQCNFCWSGQHEGVATLTCVVNPEVGRELELSRLTPTSAAREVVIVGGGPAGLQAARTAAERGHHVTLYERTDVLGGKAGPDGGLGGHPDLPRSTAWFTDEIARLGVTVKLGIEVTAEMIASALPNTVIVATGASPVLPGISSDGSVLMAATMAEVRLDLTGRRAVVADEDGHYWAAQVAEELAQRGADVVILTRFFEPFRELPIVSRIAALAKLDELGAQVKPTHEIVAVRAGGLDIRHYDSRRTSRVDDVDVAMWVGPQRPNGELAAELSARLPDVQVHLVGDARSPRRLRHAIREAHDAALSI